VAAGLVLRLTWWTQAAHVTIAIPLVLCIPGWPDSTLGVIANVVLTGLLIAGTRFGWLSQDAP